MNNPSTMTQPRLWTLILGLLLTLQTACTNGVTHLGADGDEEKFLKLLTPEERSFWGNIKDKGFQKTFVEYFFTNYINKPENPRHLNLEKGKRYFQGNKDHFIEHVLEKNITHKKKARIVYKYLCGNLVEKIGYIFDHVDDIKSAEKLVKDFCSYLPEHDQQYIGYTFCKYTNKKEVIKCLIQTYIQLGLDYRLRSVLLIKDDAELRSRLVCGLLEHPYQAGNPEEVILSAIIKSTALDDGLKCELIEGLLNKDFRHVSKATIKKMLKIAPSEQLKVLLRTKE